VPLPVTPSQRERTFSKAAWIGAEPDADARLIGHMKLSKRRMMDVAMHSYGDMMMTARKTAKRRIEERRVAGDS
jgi:hypothetical protein